MSPLTTALLNPVLAIVPHLDPVPAPGDVKPGWVAAALVVFLIAATVVLWFSLRKQLGKVRFEEDQSQDEQSAPTDPHRENGV